MQNALKSNECQKIWVHKTFKIEIQKGGPNNSDFLQNWFPPEIRSPLFNLQKIQDYEKITPELCRMHWNVMNDEEILYLKLLKLKYRMGNQIIQTFCKIGSPLRPPSPPPPPRNYVPLSLIFRNFKTLRKVPLNHAQCIEI